MAMDQRTILHAVADGRLSPDEAARALDELHREGVDDTGADPGSPGAAGAASRPDQGTGQTDFGREGAGQEGAGQEGADRSGAGGQGLDRKVKISAAARSVRVIGDPTVTEASVEGRHRAQHIGNTLHIDGSVKPNEEAGFSFDRPGSWHRQWQHWRHFSEPLVVRVNPAAALDIDVSAGSLSVQDVTGPVSIVLAAGSARLDDLNGPLDVEVRAGAVRISGRIDAHESRIRCEAGSVSLHLAPGSSVRIRARAELGRVRVAGLASADSVFGASREFSVGGGNARLEIDTMMGSVEIFGHDVTAAEARA